MMFVNFGFSFLFGSGWTQPNSDVGEIMKKVVLDEFDHLVYKKSYLYLDTRIFLKKRSKLINFSRV